MHEDEPIVDAQGASTAESALDTPTDCEQYIPRVSFLLETGTARFMLMCKKPLQGTDETAVCFCDDLLATGVTVSRTPWW